MVSGNCQVIKKKRCKENGQIIKHSEQRRRENSETLGQEREMRPFAREASKNI